MNISVMMDVVILAVLILCAALGWKKGLIRTLTELAAVVLAMLLSVQAAKIAAPKVVDQYLRPATHAAIEQRVDEMMAENTLPRSPVQELEHVAEAIPNSFVREHVLELIGGLGLSQEESLTASARETLLRMGYQVADAALDGVVRDLIQSILCAALFVVLNVLLRLMSRVLRLAEKLPGVRQLNELGGALVGLGKGLILVCLAVWVLGQAGVITPEMAAESVVLGILPGWISGAGK